METMAVHYPDVLVAFIEVAIGIAGFSSIVVVLSKDRLSTEAKGVFSQLWMQSFGIIMFATLPLVLIGQYPDDPHRAYINSSLVFGCYLVVILPLALYARTRISGAPPNLKLLPLFMIQPGFALLNFFVIGQPWVYIALLVWGITIAFISFYLMVVSQFGLADQDA